MFIATALGNFGFRISNFGFTRMSPSREDRSGGAMEIPNSEFRIPNLYRVANTLREVR